MSLPINPVEIALAALDDHLRRSFTFASLYAKITLRSIMAIQNSNVCDVVLCRRCCLPESLALPNVARTGQFLRDWIGWGHGNPPSPGPDGTA